MLWKIYAIETGKILKAGFESEERAKEWLEERYESPEETFMIEEMDVDEEAEWLEQHGGEEEEEEVADDEEEEDEDDDVATYGDEYYEGDIGDDDYPEGYDEEEEEDDDY